MPTQVNDPRFAWTQFYEAIADKLLSFKDRRGKLLDGIRAIEKSVPRFPEFLNKNADGTMIPLQDICPFTVIGIFNRGFTDSNRKALAQALAMFLGVTEKVPQSLDGIPILTHMKSWFFGFEADRKNEDIDTLWEVFAKALTFADQDDDQQVASAFAAAYERALQIKGVDRNLSIGLHWIRPWKFVSLDVHSQVYVQHCNIQAGPKIYRMGQGYLELLQKLIAYFQSSNSFVHSFPELSLTAWNERKKKHSKPKDTPKIDEKFPALTPSKPVLSYNVDSILSDGCFSPRKEIESMIDCLHTKKNLILQGPPGTGKTWLAKRLAFALMGERDQSRVYAVQFHPNLSYEDFVRGYRPAGKGNLSIVNGPFMKRIQAAKEDPKKTHVVIIEEINRGNPAQIFGEMLTLLEADKRKPEEALALSYKLEGDEEERVYIPENLYVIGTMNIADRSLALVDIALRRRFAFVDLKPVFGDVWSQWVHKHNGIAEDILKEIQKRLDALNQIIEDDPTLGPDYCVGHSFVTPRSNERIDNAQEWFKRIVKNEIGPLLKEYWTSACERKKALKAQKELLDGF